MRIENCPLEFECEQSWSKLKRTEVKRVRHCPACSENVHLCRSEAELEAARSEGKCVALVRREPELPVRGRPMGRGPWQGGD